MIKSDNVLIEWKRLSCDFDNKLEGKADRYQIGDNARYSARV